MANTYTTILKLAKPATGDAGWGTTINDKVTNLVEQAVAGKATINSWAGNSHTLAINEGASSDHRCAILILTDTSSGLSGAGTVVCPAQSKLYVVDNRAGQTVTIKTASGTGIAILNGKVGSVYCDGTNVKEADYVAALNATTVTSAGLITANTLKVGSSGAGAMTEIADEDTMTSNSNTKLATQQSIKAYVDTTGNLRRSERIYPWGSSDSSSQVGTQPPKIIVAEDATVTVATFDLYGNARTVYQELALTIGGRISNSGTHSDPVLTDVSVRVQRKSTGATGTSIGAVTVADAKQGGGSSYWYSISVSGDQTSKIDSFSFLDDAANGASKKKIQSATYDDSTNRTTLVYDNNASSAGLFSGTGGTVYVSSSGFESEGTWVTAMPFVPSYDTEGLNETFELTEFLPITSAGAALSSRKQVTFPTLKVVPDSGGAGNLEMRVQVLAGQTSSTGQYTFNVLQVDQTNITRT